MRQVKSEEVPINNDWQRLAAAIIKQAIRDACRKEPSISVPAIKWLYTTDLLIMCGLDRTYIIKKVKDEIQRRKRK